MTQNNQLAIHIKLLWAGLAILGLLFIIAAYSYGQQIRNNQASEVVASYLAYYDQSKYNFCYDRSIVPCNDDTIGTWNSTHEDDQFVFKRDQQIGDEVEKILQHR